MDDSQHNKKYACVFFSMVDGWVMRVDVFDSRDDAIEYMNSQVDRMFEEYKETMPETEPFIRDAAGLATILYACGEREYSWSVERINVH